MFKELDYLRENIILRRLPPERRANIEVVLSAYASVVKQQAYLTMPVTTGKRYYELLDKYGAKSAAELEQKRPGAIREEIIMPNIEDGKRLGQKLQGGCVHALLVPGVFEGRPQRWDQDEYMALWLTVLTRNIRRLYLSKDWEYTNGGSMEFARAVLIQFGCIDSRREPMEILNHDGVPLDVTEGAHRLAEAIKDLGRRGHDTTSLTEELGRVAGMIAMLCSHDVDSRHAYSRHILDRGLTIPNWTAVDAAQSVGARVHFHFD